MRQHFIHHQPPEPSRINPIENWEPCNKASRGLYNKPSGGIWTSPATAEFSWHDWCEREDWFDELDAVYELRPKDDVAIYTIDSRADLNEVIERFGRDDTRFDSINFEQFFDKYDGLHLTTEGESATRHGEPNLNGWDVASVLWDGWHFDEVKRLAEVV